MKTIEQKVRDFFRNYPVKRFKKSQIIIHAAEPPEGIYYIIAGQINQYDIAPNGNTIVVNVFQPPAFFPVSWVINKTPNIYFFEASTDVTVQLAPPDQVVEFLKTEPDVLLDLLGRVYRGTEGVLRRMAHLMGGDSHSRLQFELLNAAYRFGERQPDGSIHVPMKESDLAKHSGLARETINRNLQNLKAAGLISVTHQGYILHDFARLEDELGAGL